MYECYQLVFKIKCRTKSAIRETKIKNKPEKGVQFLFFFSFLFCVQHFLLFFLLLLLLEKAFYLSNQPQILFIVFVQHSVVQHYYYSKRNHMLVDVCNVFKFMDFVCSQKRAIKERKIHINKAGFFFLNFKMQFESNTVFRTSFNIDSIYCKIL